MPEYLSPGVYVQEIDSGAHEVPGVSTSIGDKDMRSLVAEIKKAVIAVAPAWSGSTEADPGLTLIEIFAFLTDNLLHRATEIPERSRAAALRAAALLSALGRSCPEKGASSLKRPRYFSGQLLDVDTLMAEQEYLRQKIRLHNRTLHGVGIVRGLQVQVEPPSDSAGGRVTVEPGYALDSCGEELSVRSRARVALPIDVSEVFVSLRYLEVPCHQVASLADDQRQFDRIEEACAIDIGQTVSTGGVVLARLTRADSRWSVDTSYVPLRVR